MIEISVANNKNFQNSEVVFKFNRKVKYFHLIPMGVLLFYAFKFYYTNKVDASFMLILILLIYLIVLIVALRTAIKKITTNSHTREIILECFGGKTEKLDMREYVCHRCYVTIDRFPRCVIELITKEKFKSRLLVVDEAVSEFSKVYISDNLIKLSEILEHDFYITKLP